MVPISIVTRKATCPRCKAALKNGVPRFGPTQVQCYKCSLIIDTGLPTWQEVPDVNRRLKALGEIIAPSYLGEFFYALILNFFVFFLFLAGSSCALFTVFFPLNSPSSPTGWDVLKLFALGYFLIPVLQLRRAIKESNKYSETGEPPVWKAL